MNIGTEIPEDYVTMKGACLAVTGSGKSYGMGALIEEFEKKEIPYVLFDVMGAHYGLTEKFPRAIFGGSKGLPLDHEEGKMYAEAIVDSNESAIFDLSHWNDFQMQIFVGEFLQELFRLHSETKTPRHIFVEEAEVFFPQQGYDDSKKSLLAGNKIMKRGRSFGLGMTLITQRPQDVNKKTLSQSQCTFILHMEGLQEMEVIKKMLRNVDKDKREKLINRILEFKQGECLLYSPSWLGRIEEFKFRKRETYHAGDTPELNKTFKEPTLQTITKPFNDEYIFDEELSPEEEESVVIETAATDQKKMLKPVIAWSALILALTVGILTGFL